MGQHLATEPEGSSDRTTLPASTGAPVGQSSAPAPERQAESAQSARLPEQEYWQPPSEREESTEAGGVSEWLTHPMVSIRPQPSTERPQPRMSIEWRKVTLWQAVKWPFRKLALGIYLLAESIRTRPRTAAMTVVILALSVLLVGAIASQTQPNSSLAGTHGRTPQSVVIAQSGLPSLPASVQRNVTGNQRFDAAEIWQSFAPAMRANSATPTEAQLATTLAQQKATGIQYTRFIYSGGYRSADGTGHYLIEAIAREKGATRVFTWYYQVGTDGLITQEVDLTPR